MKESREEDVSALLLGAFEKDRLLVHDVFRKPGWRLFEARDRRRAVHCLERNPVQVVLAETNGRNWNWKGVLQDLRQLAFPPQLLVASHNADESLWAEVLNFGAFDLLMQPLVRDEVERVVASARRHFRAPALRSRRGPTLSAAGVA